MTRSDSTSDIIGFFLGFFLGCCGLFVATLMFRQVYLRAALAGLATRYLLVVGISVLPVVEETAFPAYRQRSPLEDVPWELVGAFMLTTVFFAGLVAGAIWAFAPRDGGDDDDEPPASAPRDVPYVTYDRGPPRR